jgi:anti-sigma factor RsiW
MTDDHAAARLIAALLGPGEPELTCEACFEHLDRYVDVTLAGDDPELAVPGMRAHLTGCPACAEDFESLLAYVAARDDAPPDRPGT